ncbi:MAG TPA: YlxR family protein [Dehalococcoidia bacterium]|nr:YlxR family protein [Dehalococcoidia bacterium]
MPKPQAGPRPRHVPQRTCIACRSTEAKRGLVRVVRTPEGRVELDPTGKKNGRGAYVHETRECWDEALKKERLGRALKVTMPPQDLEQLRTHAAGLPAASSSQ